MNNTILKTQMHSEIFVLFGKHAREMQWRQCDCCSARLRDAVYMVGGGRSSVEISITASEFENNGIGPVGDRTTTV